jgi:hypothetical protein
VVVHRQGLSRPKVYAWCQVLHVGAVDLESRANVAKYAGKEKTMQMLYDSDSFVVVHMQANEPADGEPAPRIARHGFEIVDKRTNKEVYLDGSWADAFQKQINAWQLNTPTQEEVEEKLEGYAELAQNPLVLH